MNDFMVLFPILWFNIIILTLLGTWGIWSPDVFSPDVFEFRFRIVRDAHFVQQGFHGNLVHLQPDFPRVTPKTSAVSSS